jgi:hypothetical protein
MKSEEEMIRGDDYGGYSSLKSRQNNFLDSDRNTVPINI